MNEAFGAIGNAFGKGIHPVVRKSAKKTIKKAAKYIGRTYVSNQVSDFAYGGIYEFESWYSNMWIDRAFGN